MDDGCTPKELEEIRSVPKLPPVPYANFETLPYEIDRSVVVEDHIKWGTAPGLDVIVKEILKESP